MKEITSSLNLPFTWLTTRYKLGTVPPCPANYAPRYVRERAGPIDGLPNSTAEITVTDRRVKFLRASLAAVERNVNVIIEERRRIIEEKEQACSNVWQLRNSSMTSDKNPFNVYFVYRTGRTTARAD